MSAYWKKFAIGAAGATALFWAARQGYLGASAQAYAVQISTSEIITGVPV